MVVLMSRNNKSTRYPAFFQFLSNNTFSYNSLFSHYAWNMALSESLYPTFQTLEITLRNSIHNAAHQYFKREGWYRDRQIIKHPNDVGALDKAKKALTRMLLT